MAFPRPRSGTRCPTSTTISPPVGQELVQSDDPSPAKSLARDLGTRAHVELPIARVTATPRSLVGVTPDEPSRVLIWAVMPATRGSSRPATMRSPRSIRSLAGRTGAGIAVVAFDERRTRRQRARDRRSSRSNAVGHHRRARRPRRRATAFRHDLRRPHTDVRRIREALGRARGDHAQHLEPGVGRGRAWRRSRSLARRSCARPGAR